MFFPQFLPNTEAEDKKQQSNTQSCNGNRIAENKNSGLQIVRGRNEVDSLLLKTISDLDSEREGSVKKLTTALKDDPKINQRDILLFYLENLPKLKEKNNEHGIWNATLVLSTLEGSVLEKEKGGIGKFYQEIYNQPGWEDTSKIYRTIAVKAGISLKEGKPKGIYRRIIDDLF